MAKIKLINKTIVTRLDKRLVDPDVIANRFLAKIERASDELNAALQDAIEKEIRKSPVIRALINPAIGVRGYDLPAEFGLTEAQATRAVELIIATLLKSCQVTVKKVGGNRRVKGVPSATIVIRSKYLDREFYEGKFDKRPLAYPSKSDTVPWMEWLLHASNQNAALGITKSIKDYGITYSLTDKAKKYSRSGRALMIPKHVFSKFSQKNVPNPRQAIRFFPYEFPEVAKPVAGARNFIDEVVKNTRFIENLKNKLDRIVEKYLR